MKSVQLTPITDWQAWILTGPDSTSAFIGMEIPTEVMTAVFSDGNLIAKTGRDEFLAFVKDTAVQPQSSWCFRRHDRIMHIQGHAWTEVMLCLCQFDFHRMQPCEWQMLAVAGVNCWLWKDPHPDQGILIGFDPGYAEYLEHIFHDVINEIELRSVNLGGAL